MPIALQLWLLQYCSVPHALPGRQADCHIKGRPFTLGSCLDGSLLDQLQQAVVGQGAWTPLVSAICQSHSIVADAMSTQARI